MQKLSEKTQIDNKYVDTLSEVFNILTKEIDNIIYVNP